MKKRKRKEESVNAKGIIVVLGIVLILLIAVIGVEVYMGLGSLQPEDSVSASDMTGAVVLNVVKASGDYSGAPEDG